MRRTETQPLKDALRAYTKALGIDRKMLEVRLIKSWEEVVGKLLAQYTTKIYIYNSKLFVHINSSIARSELFMVRESLANQLNDKVGEKVITEIVFR